jgi:hypothetical protein
MKQALKKSTNRTNKQKPIKLQREVNHFKSFNRHGLISLHFHQSSYSSQNAMAPRHKYLYKKRRRNEENKGIQMSIQI